MFNLKEFLAMSEEERNKWYFIHGVIKHHPTDEFRIESEADLAFRLRDEVDKRYLHNLGDQYGETHPLYVSMNHVWGMLEHATTYGFDAFWLYQAQPVHWIAAALQAKEMSK